MHSAGIGTILIGMGRVALVAAALAAVLAAPQRAAAAPCNGCNGGIPPAGEQGQVLARSTWLGWATTVNSAFTAFDVYHLARHGGRNPKVTGIQMVMALPVALYGFDYVKKDKSDYLAWGLSLWSVGLIVQASTPSSRASSRTRTRRRMESPARSTPVRRLSSAGTTKFRAPG